jgi:hypothetical protein
VEELLQQQHIPDLSGAMGSVALMWAAWPVICGLLGARRGQMMKGALNGLLWGPIGIFIILLEPVKYCCPTCGQKTLKQPHAGLPEASAIDARPAKLQPMTIARPVAAEVEELVRLQAWVNGEAAMNWPSNSQRAHAGELVAAD